MYISKKKRCFYITDVQLSSLLNLAPIQYFYLIYCLDSNIVHWLNKVLYCLFLPSSIGPDGELELAFHCYVSLVSFNLKHSHNLYLWHWNILKNRVSFFLLHRTFLIWSCLMFPHDYIQMNCFLIKYYIRNIPSFLGNTFRKPNYFQCGIQGLYILTLPRVYTLLLILTTEPCLADPLGISHCSIYLAVQVHSFGKCPPPNFLLIRLNPHGFHGVDSQLCGSWYITRNQELSIKVHPLPSHRHTIKAEHTSQVRPSWPFPVPFWTYLFPRSFVNDEEHMCESVEEGHLITSFLRMRKKCRGKLKCVCERRR